MEDKKKQEMLVKIFLMQQCIINNDCKGALIQNDKLACQLRQTLDKKDPKSAENARKGGVSEIKNEK